MINFRGIICKMFMYVCWIIPVKSEKVVCTSYYGKYYNDSPKCIYRAMKEKHPEYDYVWIMEDTKIDTDGARNVKVASFKSLYELATARIWIDNSRKREWMVKRKGQFYVQTWHAGIGLKKAERAVEEKLSKKYILCAKNDSKMADLFLSNSRWMNDIYRKNFWYDGEILQKGLPRDDIYFQEAKQYHHKVAQYYELDDEWNFLLYAPTFREDEQLKCYYKNFYELVETLHKKWGGKWKILLRLHPNISQKQNEIEYDDIVLNASSYDDMGELVMASDFLLTDYSSCMFDAMLAGKKVILYASDLGSYTEERGFLFDLDELPFEITQKEKELLEKIVSFDETKYREKIKKFEQECGFFVKGQGTKNVVERILQEINKR